MSELSILVVIICAIAVILMIWGWSLFTDFKTRLGEFLAISFSTIFSIFVIWCLTFIR